METKLMCKVSSSKRDNVHEGNSFEFYGRKNSLTCEQARVWNCANGYERTLIS